MSIHPFSLNKTKKRFPGFEFLTVVFLLTTFYIIGLLFLPSLFSAVEQKLLYPNEQRLVTAVKHSMLFEELNEGESNIYTVADLIENGAFEKSENQPFLARYAEKSYVMVVLEDGAYVYTVSLIER